MEHTQYKIAVVTNANGPSMQDLKRVADEHNVVFDSVNFAFVSLTDLENSELIAKLSTYDVVYYRTGMRDTTLNKLSRILREKNIPVVNGNESHLNAHRKIQQALICAEHGIKHPKSYMVTKYKYDVAAELLGETFVVKPDVGSKGKHVSLARNQADIDVLKEHSSPTNKLLFQEYLEGAQEYRVYTIGNEGVASYKKIPGETDFRANLHAGGSMIETEPELVTMLNEFSAKVAEAFEADLSGVDVLVKDGECYMLEINFQPGWENLDSLTGMNLSKETLQYILNRAHENAH